MDLHNILYFLLAGVNNIRNAVIIRARIQLI